ncbi:MAG TPA: hypothetical protein VKW77_08885, partial [Acidimicrobiales bacterium]|nr:hypothetical protein [Acidimicrobiales bacterium]
SEERILEAKSEILGPARTVVLPVDDERLARLADRAQAEGKRVIRCSTADRWADVCVERAPSSVLTVYVAGEPVAKDVSAPLGVQPRNLACAMGVVVALGLDPRRAAERIEAVQVADHRLAVARAPSGVVVVDDTYNSNPAGAASALDALSAAANGTAADGEGDGAGPGGEPRSAPVRRLAVVTPGMVELGPRQFEENARFAACAAKKATDLVVVGRTNRRALLAGAASEPAAACRVHRVGRREDAVAWVRRNLGPGDVVLYENDLPDHYP